MSKITIGSLLGGYSDTLPSYREYVLEKKAQADDAAWNQTLLDYERENATAEREHDFALMAKELENSMTLADFKNKAKGVGGTKTPEVRGKSTYGDASFLKSDGSNTSYGKAAMEDVEATIESEIASGAITDEGSKKVIDYISKFEEDAEKKGLGGMGSSLKERYPEYFSVPVEEYEKYGGEGKPSVKKKVFDDSGTTMGLEERENLAADEIEALNPPPTSRNDPRVTAILEKYGVK